MKFLRYFCFTILFFLCLFFASAQDVQKADAALMSDNIRNALTINGFNPIIQELDNTLSQDFPYNVIIEHDANLENIEDKNLIIVIPQNYATDFLPEYINFLQTLISRDYPYSINVVFTANDSNTIVDSTFNSKYPFFEPQGSKTYINSLNNNENTASIILEAQSSSNETDSFTSMLSFDELVKITPGGKASEQEELITPLGFFKTIITSFAKANVLYYVEGYFLTLYRLNFISNNSLLGVWLESDIASILINLNTSNSENVFLMLNTLLDEYSYSDLSNVDTNYSYIQLFSQTYFLTEEFYLITLFISISIILFAFFYFSFMRGKHHQIHKLEFMRTWYLFPLIVFITGLFLYISQNVISVFVPHEHNLILFSFIIKIAFTILFLMLFSLFQFLVKIPLTGFIYAYMLSISALINIVIFSLVEITLFPLFLGQYIIIQVSQKMRKVHHITICLALMILPFFPYIFNVAQLDYLQSFDYISNASFFNNILMACILLPFQIMAIRILIRLKLWGMKLKINQKKIIKFILFVISTFIVLLITMLITVKIYTSTRKTITQQELESLYNNFNINIEQESQLGYTLHTVRVNTVEQVLRYTIEISSQDPLPIFDANYPYDILSKSYTAIFTIDEHPPNPFILSFTSKGDLEITCIITAWIQTEFGIEKITLQPTLRVLQ